MEGLNRTQLKMIAILAMVCDHSAWGFVEFMSPLGQIMHIIGRFTLPIMCFFIAEGFRKTSSGKEYLLRMGFFAVVSALPFYLFFGELYYYRQNIIFDLLLGLLVLNVLENRKWRKWVKGVCVTGIFFISCTVGGWVIMPILYILVFYYVKDFKRQAVWICALTMLMEVFIIISMLLNNIYHFSRYDWPWYDKLYLLGFMLPLLVLKYYNGEKGKEYLGKYFFYLFYPAHFLVLAILKKIVEGITPYELYVGVHIIALLICLFILVIVLWARPSRGQSATLLLVSSGCIYTFGFLVEITSGNTGGFYAGTLLQYFGECILMVAFTMFVAQMCHREIPAFVYALETLAGIFIMWMLFTTRENHFFYKGIGINEEGPFSRLSLEYGWGFIFFVIYLVIVCTGCLIVCGIGIYKSTGLERKRIACTMISVFFPWAPNFIRLTGITGGYEIPCFGIMGAVVFVGMALIRYGYFDSVSLAGENALSHGQEGIMVINNHHIITYFNQRMNDVFGQLKLNQDAYKNDDLKKIFEGKMKRLETNEKIFEMRIEPLHEAGHIQGQMLWLLDITEHHRMLMQISELANKDALTGLYNRSYFITLLEEYLNTGKTGSFFMMDLDHFRQINDRFGHQAGDEILHKFGEILLAQGEETFSCRIGGDEFCLFYKEAIDTKELECMATKIASDFWKVMLGEKYADKIKVSFGIARILEKEERNFERIYSHADKALYVAKNRSKNAWYIL